LSDLRLKCTKFYFSWGSAPDPAGGAYIAPQDPKLDIRGPTSKGREGKEGRKERRTVSVLCRSQAAALDLPFNSDINASDFTSIFDTIIKAGL